MSRRLVGFVVTRVKLGERPLHARVDLREVLVGGFPHTAPVAIIVNHQDTAPTHTGKQLLELMPRGLVPVRVEPEDRDLLGTLFAAPYAVMLIVQVGPAVPLTVSVPDDVAA